MALISARRRATPRLTQDEIACLAEMHEPEASASPLAYRMATCVVCGRRMIRMWHAWTSSGGFKKEVHLCRRCGRGLAR